MTGGPQPAMVLFVADVARVAAFYRALAAMQRVGGDADHEVLEVAGFQLVVHRLRGEGEPVRDANGRPPVREDSYCKLCLPVDRIAAARARAAAHGGFVAPPDREWTARGFRACDGHDPEGNVIQVREAAP